MTSPTAQSTAPQGKAWTPTPLALPLHVLPQRERQGSFTRDYYVLKTGDGAAIAEFTSPVAAGQVTDRVNSHASLLRERDALREALEAQQSAEDSHANCEDCSQHPTRDWACCGPCSERFGKAIDMRSAILHVRHVGHSATCDMNSRLKAFPLCTCGFDAALQVRHD